MMGRSYAEFDSATKTVRGRYSATVFGEDEPFAYSDFEDVIMQSAKRRQKTLTDRQLIIVADRRLHTTIATLEPLPRKERK